MAKTWYPVIDYSICTECGICVSRCPHSVYDTAKAPAPVVTRPDACVDHCHGCGNRCPVGAITYVGDDTGWTPPNGSHKEARPVNSCCDPNQYSKGESCECSLDEPNNFLKSAFIDYLCLDLETCDRCIGTDQVLDEVVMTLTPALLMAGYKVEYSKFILSTEEDARKHSFISSPTIRVNGKDICLSVAENDCGCCSDISGTDVTCRVFEYKGKTFDVPPKEMLAEAILSALFRDIDSGCSCGDYEMPKNLTDFFKGKRSKSACSCGENCC